MKKIYKLTRNATDFCDTGYTLHFAVVQTVLHPTNRAILQVFRVMKGCDHSQKLLSACTTLTIAYVVKSGKWTWLSRIHIAHSGHKVSHVRDHKNASSVNYNRALPFAPLPKPLIPSGQLSRDWYSCGPFGRRRWTSNGEEIRAAVTMLACWKVAGAKTCHLRYDVCAIP